VARAAYWELRDAGTGLLHRPRIETVLACDNGDAIREAVIAGLGVTVLPAFIACDALRAGALQALFRDVERDPVHLYAVYPSKRNLHPTTAAFVSFVIERFSRDAWADEPAPPPAPAAPRRRSTRG